MYKRMVCGVLVDDTELYDQIDYYKNKASYWENKYKELELKINGYMKPEIKCNKCNGTMKYIDQFNTYVCLTCGNTI